MPAFAPDLPLSPPSPSRRLGSLVALRGIAVLMVFLFHFVSHFQTAGVLPKSVVLLLATGMFGVDLFYVLSGFFITRVVLGPPVWQPWAYLRARITRIYPAYVACLLLLALLAIVQSRRSLHDTLEPLALHLVMLHHLVPGLGGSFNGVFWTLGVEFPYYLLMLLLAPWLRKPGRFWPVSLAMVGLALAYRIACFYWFAADTAIPVNRFYASSQMPGALDAFFFGGMAAWLAAPRQTQLSGHAAWPRWLGLGGSLLLLLWVSHQLGAFWHTPWIMGLWRSLLIAAFALTVYALVNRPLGPEGLVRPLAFLGKISFSFYLWHLPVIDLLSPTAQGDSSTWAIVLGQLGSTLAVTVGIAWLSWRFVEQRFHPAAAR